jgi:uncharacterized protein (DUF1499 family)
MLLQVESSRPDNFEPHIVKKTDDYLYVEYVSPTFGFTDDVEFFFPGNDQVEYRSASRIGNQSPSSISWSFSNAFSMIGVSLCLLKNYVCDFLILSDCLNSTIYGRCCDETGESDFNINRKRIKALRQVSPSGCWAVPYFIA